MMIDEAKTQVEDEAGSQNGAAIVGGPGPSIYTQQELSRELRQGEIITDLTQYVYDPVVDGALTIVQPFVIVATQDCDLLQDYDQREKGEQPTLNGVLLFEAQPAPDVKFDRDIRRRVFNNKDERYHFLENVPPECDCRGQGLPGLVIDFKRCFTMHPPEVHRQLTSADGAKRRTRLEMPYREHLQTRIAFYFQRVMIPRQHKNVSTSALAQLPKPINKG